METNLFSVEDNRSGIPFIYTAQNLDKGGFSGSVLADQGVHLSTLHLESDIVKGLKPAEMFGNVFSLQYALVH
jgi:hypothetical protein